MSDLPVAWEVASTTDAKAIKSKAERLVVRERFGSKDAAVARKEQLQREGKVASVVPVFASKRTREARNRKRQYTPFGDFCADWTMHE